MTWTVPQITRVVEPLAALTGDERTLADAWLEFHRQTLLWKCGGLTAEQLKFRGIEPSGLSLLGLVRHMAEIERDWFRTRFAGEQVGYLYCSDDDLSAEFDVESADAEADLAAYNWVYFTMIPEYARHNGHADLLRERIDGSTGH